MEIKNFNEKCFFLILWSYYPFSPNETIKNDIALTFRFCNSEEIAYIQVSTFRLYYDLNTRNNVITNFTNIFIYFIYYRIIIL